MDSDEEEYPDKSESPTNQRVRKMSNYDEVHQVVMPRDFDEKVTGDEEPLRTKQTQESPKKRGELSPVF